MYVRCQACGVTLDVRDDVARSVPQIPCASCGRPVPLMAAAPPAAVPPPAVQISGPVPIPPSAAGNKTAQYAMAGMGGAVVLLLGVVIVLMMNRGGDSVTPPTVAAQSPANAAEAPLPEPDVGEEAAEPPPGDLQSQVTARQKEVTALQQALVPLRNDKQRLETEINQLTDSE